MYLRPLICLICVFMLANIADAAPFAYITNAGTGGAGTTDSVSVIDTGAIPNSIVSTVTLLGPNNTSVPTHPYGVAINPAGSRVFISNQATKTISVIDASSTDNRVIGSIDNGGLKPGGLAVTPAGSRLLVANDASTSITVYDANPPYAVKGTINDTTNNGFEGIAIVPGTGGAFTAYVTATGSNKVVVINGNEGTDVYTKATDIVVGTNPIGIAYNPTNQKLYVANSFGGSVSVIAASSNTVTSTIALTGATPTPVGVAVDATGNKVYVTDNKNNSVSIIDGSNDTLLTSPTIVTGQAPYGVAFNPANNTLYVANGQTSTPPGTVTAFNTSTQASGSINVGSNPLAFGNFIGPDMACVITVTSDANGTTSPAPGASDSKIYGATGQDLIVAAAPNCGFAVNTFTADGSGVASPHTFPTCNAAHTVGATFTRTGWELPITKSGVGTGTVSCTPTGAGCTDGNKGYDFSTTVTCTATADSPYSFGGWTNCTGTVTGNVCTITIPGAGGPAPATLGASFTNGGEVKTYSDGMYYSTVMGGAYPALLATHTGMTVVTTHAPEALNFSRSDAALVFYLYGGYGDLTHTPPATGRTRITSLNVGGTNTVEIKDIDIY